MRKVHTTRKYLSLVACVAGVITLTACLPDSAESEPAKPDPHEQPTTTAKSKRKPRSTTSSSTSTTTTTTPDSGAVPADGAAGGSGPGGTGGPGPGAGGSGGSSPGGGNQQPGGNPAFVGGWTQNGPLGGCPVFPADNAWNRDISSSPLAAGSQQYVNTIGSLGGNQFLHADFGGGGAYGIPYITVGGNQPKTPVNFVDYGDESDPGPYPIPLDAPVEGGSDRHVLAIDRDNCTLYELFGAYPNGGQWDASSGAVFNLRSNALRPDTWTSADAAGLPIFPGLVRFDEVANGYIGHALRFTVSRTQRGFIHPATHWASSDTNPALPPMGLRFRLKASYDISGYHGQARVVLEALKRFGMIVADNGSNWFITGAADSRWNDDDLNQLKSVPGGAFEVVDTGEPIHH